MNPCPCGHLGDPRRSCDCTEPLIDRYRARPSGPLLDRIDFHVEVPAPSLRELRREPGEPSVAVATRVAAARAVQQARFPGRPLPIDAAMDAADVRRWCFLDSAGERLLAAAFERLGLSATKTLAPPSAAAPPEAPPEAADHERRFSVMSGALRS